MSEALTKIHDQIRALCMQVDDPMLFGIRCGLLRVDERLTTLGGEAGQLRYLIRTHKVLDDIREEYFRFEDGLPDDLMDALTELMAAVRQLALTTEALNESDRAARLEFLAFCTYHLLSVRGAFENLVIEELGIAA